MITARPLFGPSLMKSIPLRTRNAIAPPSIPPDRRNVTIARVSSCYHRAMFSRRAEMRALHLIVVVSMMTCVAGMLLTAQERGAAPAAPAMTLTVAGFADGADIPVKFSQAAPGAAPGEGT